MNIFLNIFLKDKDWTDLVIENISSVMCQLMEESPGHQGGDSLTDDIIIWE